MVQSEAKKITHNRDVRVQGRSPFEPRRICILNETEAKAMEHLGVGYKCQSFHHRHFTRAKVDGLVLNGEMEWVGIGKNKAKWVEGRSWRKTMCVGAGFAIPTMQLVRGGSRV